MLRHLLLFIVLVSASPVWAGVVISGTRVIYPSDKKEVTINLTNKGQNASLVQSWVDAGDPTVSPAQVKVPFVIFPPITRIDAGKGQMLRLIYTGSNLPNDRESVFWLNVLAVPPKQHDDKNYLNVAYQSRLKIFYRPQTLTGSVEEAAASLKITKKSKGFSVVNPTPFYISLVEIEWQSGNKEHVVQGEMIAPYGSLTLDTDDYASLRNATACHIKCINDFGAIKQIRLASGC